MRSRLKMSEMLITNVFFQVHRKLNTGEKQIRIIELQPGVGDAPIKIKLIPTSLKGAISYQALSYAWGDIHITVPIAVDGLPYSITTNLYIALRNLRGPTQPRLLWVDAVSINQHDNEEKSEQVNSMDVIYASANTCLAWLGDFTNDGITVPEAEAALNVIRRLAGSDPPVSLVPYSRILSALESLMNSEWWRRRWTTQEIVLPPRPLIVWGSLSISWETLASAVDNLIEGNYSLPFELLPFFSGMRFTTPIKAIGILRDFWLKPELETPASLLWRIGLRYASDPRDNVYALSALLSRLFPVEADYSLTTAQVYTRIMISILRTTKDLECWIGLRGQIGQTKDLPSWVTDWDEPRVVSHRANHFWDHRYRYYNFRAHAGRKLEIEVDEQEKVLSLDGLLVDTIRVVGAPLRDTQDIPREELLNPLEIQHRVRLWYDTAKYYFENEPSTSNGGPVTWKDTFWRVVSSDRILDSRERVVGRPILPNDFLMFENFRTADFDDSTNLKRGYESEVYNTLNVNIFAQCFLITEQGYMGTGPATIEIGDEVWVLCGGRVPFLLRPFENHTSTELDSETGLKTSICYHKLLGDGFVDGVMDGQAIGQPGCELTRVNLL